MKLLGIVSLLMVFVVIHVSCDDRDHEENKEHHNRLDRNHIHNKKHIQDHLDGVIDKKTDDMTNEELSFHYFKTHDSDNNNLLDGIELRAAITHHHDGEKPKSLPDSEIADIMDAILAEDDINNDGYIDYTEFQASQQRSKKEKKKKDSKEDGEDKGNK